MSRYCGEQNAQPILAAGELWCRQALKQDGSVFSQDVLWCLANFEALEKHYVNNPDEGEGTFFQKLEHQLESAPAQAKQLAAEMLWVMMLCPDNVGAETKREGVRAVWGWSGSELSKDLPTLSSSTLAGVGSGGTAFSPNRWRELVFFVKMMLKFKALERGRQTSLLEDAWQFAEWLQGIPEENTRQFRHMVLFLLFPDTFERIFGGTDRKAIVAQFTDKSLKEVEKLSPLQIDRELARLRREQQARYGTPELDFYVPPLVGLWRVRDFAYFTKDIQREHVLRALSQIDKDGIPPDARSTTYDLVNMQHRYPPKLVLSLASKYATGEEFDRSLFTGGESSPAFALLRKIGFQIERKDFVETLINRFLKQAEAADDLSTNRIRSITEV